MGTPTNRTPVRVARGSSTNLTSSISDIQEGEIVWDETNNKLKIRGTDTSTDPATAVFFEHVTDSSGLAPKASPTFTGAVQNNATVTVGADDTGYDVKFFGATSGKYFLWDESADNLIIEGGTNVSGEGYFCGNDIWLRQLSSGVGQVTVDYGTSDQAIVGGDQAFYINDMSTTPAHPNLTISWDGDITSTGNDVGLTIDADGGGSDHLFQFKNSYGGSVGVYHGFIENTSAASDIYIRGKKDVYIQDSGNSNAEWIHCVDGAGVELSHAGTKKFETTSSGVTVTGAAVPASITALSYSGTSSDEIDINFNANNNFSLTTAHAATKFVVPTNAVVAGQSGSIFITQGSTTCATPIWSTQFIFSTGAAPSFTATEDKVARIDYIVQTGQAASGTEAKIHCVATDDLAATPQ